MSALMTCDSSVSDKIADYRQDCDRMGIKVLNPDFNESVHDFAPTVQNTIRFGLSAIKGIGERVIEAIVQTRKSIGGFKSIHHMLTEVDHKLLNKSVFEALVKAGAFDSTNLSRASCFKAMEGLLRWAAGKQADKKAGQKGLFGGAGADIEMIKISEEAEWEEPFKLSQEKEVLGFIISSDPIKKYGHIIKHISTYYTDSSPEQNHGSIVTVAGVITSLRINLIKAGRNSGKKMAMFKIRTQKGLMSAVLFVKEYKTYEDYIEEDMFCVFKGELDLNRDENTPSLKVSTVATIEDTLKNNYSTMIVRLGADHQIEEEKLKSIKTAISDFPGKSNLILCIDSNHRKTYSVKVNARYGVDLGETAVMRMEEVAGYGNIELR